MTRRCRGTRGGARRATGRRRAISIAAALPLLVVSLSACRTDPHSARGVAEQFVDQHYVRIDLPSAEPFCTGLARHKIDEELRLTSGQTIDASTRKPTVRYRLLSEQSEADSASFVYEATITVEDAGSFTRKWLITTHRSDDGWKVANFDEFE